MGSAKTFAASYAGCVGPADAVLVRDMADGERATTNLGDFFLREFAGLPRLGMKRAMLGKRHELHVEDVDARGLMTKMVDDESFGDRPPRVLIYRPMRMAARSQPSVATAHSASPDMAIGEVAVIYSRVPNLLGAVVAVDEAAWHPLHIAIQTVRSFSNRCVEAASAFAQSISYHLSSHGKGTATPEPYHNTGRWPAPVSEKEV